MSIVKSHLNYKILIVGMWGLLGALGIFNSSAAAQRYMFGRGDFITSQTDKLADALATGDFNRDGILDLAFTLPGFGQSAVAILLGNADGTFQPGVEYVVGSGTAPVLLQSPCGDFNGDGKLDLAVANSNCDIISCSPGTVSVLLGNGDGTFQTACGLRHRYRLGFGESRGFQWRWQAGLGCRQRELPQRHLRPRVGFHPAGQG